MKEKTMQKFNGVQSIERAFAIIELLDETGELGIAEISRRLSLERSTVHRIASTLRHLGYLSQNPSNPKYSNSFRFFEIGNNVVKRLGLRQQAAPFLRELSEKTHEAVNLAILDGNEVIFIDKIESQSTIKVDLAVGKRFPSYCTGLGKTFLAWLPEGEVADLVGPPPFVKYTKNTITELPKLMEELRQIRKDGFSLDNEEFVEGLLCLGVPVRSRSGDVVAALSVALPKYLYAGDEVKIGSVCAVLMDVAYRFSCSLGFKGNQFCEGGSCLWQK
ncbi:MAG: IclR family transcriptional regulator, regulon repressor [Synergistaceae bacterium]|jgi:DNA-binding IclR family transcriptional regulator|nr:IclR family transcriptional regulator, regulon repressor [Synergistaceae bacterium]